MHFRKLPFALLLFLTVGYCLHANAQTQALCDTLIKKGVVAMFDKKYTEALELLTQAKTMAEDHRWYKQIFLAKNNTGLTYYMMAEYGDALDYFQESYNIAIERLEPKDEMIVLNNIAILYIKEKEFNKAIDHFKKAYDIATENDIKVKQGLYGVNLGLAYNETGELKQARTYLVVDAISGRKP
jgi:tetratricopeptide (TPR) repeat protein